MTDKKLKPTPSSAKEAGSAIKGKSPSPPKPPADIHLGISSSGVNQDSKAPAFGSLKPPGPSVAIKAKPVVEEEQRKIQTELPALLQDLGTSRLLAKYKQSMAASSEGAATEITPLPEKTESNQSKAKKSRSNSNDSSSFSLLANTEPPPGNNLNKINTAHTSGRLFKNILKFN